MIFVFLHLNKNTEKNLLTHNTFIKSIYTFYPNAEIIQVSDNKTKKINGVSRVFRFDGDENKIMEFRINSNFELGLKEPAIYLDSDMIITNKFDIKKMLNLEKNVLLKRSFDLNLKLNINIKNLVFQEYRAYSINQAFPILACFLKANSYSFWKDMIKHLSSLEKKFLYWYGDQEILKRMYLQNKKNFSLVEEKFFACPPQFIEKKKFPFLIHFKGLQNKQNFENQLKLINNYLDIAKTHNNYK